IAGIHRIAAAPAGTVLGIAQFLDHVVINRAGASKVSRLASGDLLGDRAKGFVCGHQSLGSEVFFRYWLPNRVSRFLEALNLVANFNWLAAISRTCVQEKHFVPVLVLFQYAPRLWRGDALDFDTLKHVR